MLFTMNVTFLITLLTVAGLFSTVIADCDPWKCVSFLEAIDKSDPQQLCPALKTVTFCLEDLFATCPTLEPDSQTTLERSLVGVNENINNACVVVFPPPVEINTMSNDIQSDNNVEAVGWALGTLLVIAILIIVVLICKRTKSNDGTKSSKVQPDAWRPDRNSKPMFFH